MRLSPQTDVIFTMLINVMTFARYLYDRARFSSTARPVSRRVRDGGECATRKRNAIQFRAVLSTSPVRWRGWGGGVGGTRQRHAIPFCAPPPTRPVRLRAQ